LPQGTPILAATAGVVFEAGHISTNAGNGVEIRSGNVVAKYFHARTVLVSVGQHVAAGQEIATMGETGDASPAMGGGGPHLHFEVWVSGVNVNPVPYLATHGVDISC
jgi:murein DD-endopeptidase MepM/ murein hydrolase activator NlpD